MPIGTQHYLRAGITLRTDGGDNAVQGILDLLPGIGISVTDNGDGTVTISNTGSPQRQTVVLTTGMITPGTPETGTVALGKAALLLQVKIDTADFRVRLYATDAARTADASRATTTAPTVPGVLTDWDSLGAADTDPVNALPGSILWNGDSPATGDVYYSVDNLGAAPGSVEISFVIVPTEDFA